jgi:type IV pilus assembly protein PilC
VEITSETCTNRLYQDALRKASADLKTGTPLSEILLRDEKLFPPMITQMIMVGERTGEVDHLLNEVAAFYGDEVDNTMKNMSSIIEPVIIIVIGLAVGGLAVSIIMPMYTLMQNF